MLDMQQGGTHARAKATPNYGDDNVLIAALLKGDEDAFMWLVEQYHQTLLRLATLYVRERSVAEEVVQDTWLGVLNGIQRFEGRSSLKTWIFRILTNRAQTRGQRESRSIPFSALQRADMETDEPAVDESRFLPADHARWPGHWASLPQRWDEIPEARMLSLETRGQVMAAIETLPAMQREVIRLRDVDGWSSTEVCNAFEISETNQRVLLHRARSKVRRTLEQLFEAK